MDVATTWLGPALFALLAWWLSTAAILQLVALPRRTHRWTMLLATLALPALLWLWRVASPVHDSGGASGAYVAFTAALLVWGWQELAFLLGYVTGPRRRPCPDNAAGAHRVRLATETVLHHELALLALGALLWLLVREGASPVAWWTFCALWLLRLSAKLNLFLGARNLQAELLPAHLTYLASYFRRAPMNALFPLSIAGCALALALLLRAAWAEPATVHEQTGLLLVAWLVALGALEHVLLMLPRPARRSAG